MKFHVKIDWEVYDVIAMMWRESWLYVKRINNCKFYRVWTECEIIPLHNIDNTDYKKKELKKQLYFQQNMNADIVKENFDLANEVQSLRRYVDLAESQIGIAENWLEYWQDKAEYSKRSFWILFIIYVATTLLLTFI